MRAAPDAFASHACAALPAAFLACNDEEKDVAALWKEVWEEGTGSGSAAVRLYLADIVPLICAGVMAFGWIFQVPARAPSAQVREHFARSFRCLHVPHLQRCAGILSFYQVPAHAHLQRCASIRSTYQVPARVHLQRCAGICSK